MHPRVIGRDLEKIFITRCVKNKPNILAINRFLEKKISYVCLCAHVLQAEVDIWVCLGR